MKTLFKTIVGSHAWNMQRSDSDKDIFEGFIVPTKDILSGNIRKDGNYIINSTFEQDHEDNEDTARHEIGIIVKQLLKGNFNFVVGVCSPVIKEDKHGYLKELRNITERNFAKNIYQSTIGLAIHQKKKYLDNFPYIDYTHKNSKCKQIVISKKLISEENMQKKINLIVRSLMLGEWILSTGKIKFIKIGNQSIDDMYNWINKITETYKESTLPEYPNQLEFRDLLYRIRINELKGKI